MAHADSPSANSGVQSAASAKQPPGWTMGSAQVNFGLGGGETGVCVSVVTWVRMFEHDAGGVPVESRGLSRRGSRRRRHEASVAPSERLKSMRSRMNFARIEGVAPVPSRRTGNRREASPCMHGREIMCHSVPCALQSSRFRRRWNRSLGLLAHPSSCIPFPIVCLVCRCWYLGFSRRLLHAPASRWPS